MARRGQDPRGSRPYPSQHQNGDLREVVAQHDTAIGGLSESISALRGDIGNLERAIEKLGDRQRTPASVLIGMFAIAISVATLVSTTAGSLIDRELGHLRRDIESVQEREKDLRMVVRDHVLEPDPHLAYSSDIAMLKALLAIEPIPKRLDEIQRALRDRGATTGD